MNNRIVKPENLTPDQVKANATFNERRGRDVFGPYEPLLHSPDVMLDVEALGRRLRYHSVFGEKLKEMAVIMVARSMDQVYEWSVHQPIAVQYGVSIEICEAIERRKRPAHMDADETLIFETMTYFLAHKNLDDAHFSRMEVRFGKRGIVEMGALIGIYTTLAYVLNVAGTPPQAGAMPLL